MSRTLWNTAALVAASWALLSAGTGCEAMGFTTGEVQEVGALVEVAPVQQGTLERTLELTGTIEAGQSIRMVPDMPGKVIRLPVQIGDEVEKGQLLARLDTDMAALQAQQADAAVKLAKLGVETAEREFGRAEQLKASGSMTQQQYDGVKAQMEMAQQQLAQAQAAKGLANKQISGGALYAPFPGVVTEVGCEQGEYFNPMGMSMTGESLALVALINLDTIRLDLQVADEDVGKLAEGIKVHILVDSIADRLPEGGIEGTVEFIGLAADPTSRTFPVRVVADNPDRVVRAGLHARVRLVLDAKDDVLSVPDEAVRELNGQPYVMVAEGTTARRINVETGLAGDSGTEIVSGLSGDEQVIVEGNFGLPDGALIEVAQ